jgi:hypothetical protein
MSTAKFSLLKNGTPAEQLHCIHSVFDHYNRGGNWSPAEALVNGISINGDNIGKDARHFLKTILAGTVPKNFGEIVNDDLPLWCGDANVLNISIWPQVGAPNAVNDLGLYLLWLVSSLAQEICFLRLWGTDTDLTNAREVAVGCGYGACPHMTPDLASRFFRSKTLNQKQRTAGLRLFVEEVIRRSHVYRTAELESEGGGARAAREWDDKPLCQMPAAAAPATESATASASGGSASSSSSCSW